MLKYGILSIIISMFLITGRDIGFVVEGIDPIMFDIPQDEFASKLLLYVGISIVIVWSIPGYLIARLSRKIKKNSHFHLTKTNIEKRIKRVGIKHENA